MFGEGSEMIAIALQGWWVNHLPWPSFAGAERHLTSVQRVNVNVKLMETLTNTAGLTIADIMSHVFLGLINITRVIKIFPNMHSIFKPALTF